MDNLPTNLLKYFLLLTAFVGVYLIRFVLVRPSFAEGQRVRITGQISEEPLLLEGRQRIVVGGMRIFLERFPEYHYGDRIVAEGIVAKGRAGWFLKEPKVEKIETAGVFSNLREKILTLYQKLLPEPHASLLSGIVLGTKTGLEKGFFDQLRTTGTLHVVVASGMNITLFAGGILSGLSYLIGRRRAIIPALLGILFYVLLVGFQPPIVRAAIMGGIAFLAQALGREFDAWRALLISAAILLLFNPLWLFDLGFQLSFAATAGMLAFSSGTRTLLVRLPKWFGENLATTLAAQIPVAPILFVAFGQVSLISPLVNALVLWTIPFIMAGGMIVALLGLVFEPVGQLVAWFIYLPLEYFIRTVRLFAIFPALPAGGQFPFSN